MGIGIAAAVIADRSDLLGGQLPDVIGFEHILIAVHIADKIGTPVCLDDLIGSGFLRLQPVNLVLKRGDTVLIIQLRMRDFLVGAHIHGQILPACEHIAEIALLVLFVEEAFQVVLECLACFYKIVYHFCVVVGQGGVLLGASWQGEAWSQRNLADDVYDAVFEKFTITTNTGKDEEKVLFTTELSGWDKFVFQAKETWESILCWFLRNG